jgi:hypothetical protein
MKIKRRLSILLVLGATLSSVGIVVSPPAHAAPIGYGNRISAYYDATTYHGSKITGVAGRIYVRNNYTATTGSASDINLYDPSYGTFIQVGVIQGYATIMDPVNTGTGGNCTKNQYFSAPHFFVGWQWLGGPGPIGGRDFCETLVDLGQFGSTGNYRDIGLRLSSDGYYVTLDNVVKYHLPDTALKENYFRPQFTGETNDTCSYMYANAQNTGSPHDSLKFFAAGGWHYFPSSVVTRRLYHPTLYPTSSPYGLPSTLLAYGPTPNPGEC